MGEYYDYRRNCCSRGGLIGPVILIGLGIVFLLAQFHILSEQRAWNFFWPFLLIVFGVRFLADRGRVWLGIALIAIGALMAGNPLGYWTIDWDKLWPVILIVVGVGLLFSRSRGEWRWHAPAIPGSPLSPPEPTPEAAAGARVEGLAVLSGFKRRVTDQNFAGGRLTSVFGGSQVDLLQADIAGDTAVIEVDAVFGGIEIRVPYTWIIDLRGQGIFGGFSDETHQAVPAQGAKRLIVHGTAMFGGVVVKN